MLVEKPTFQISSLITPENGGSISILSSANSNYDEKSLKKKEIVETDAVIKDVVDNTSIFLKSAPILEEKYPYSDVSL